MNTRTHKIYSDRLTFYVLDLGHTEFATEEEKPCGIDRWAERFAYAITHAIKNAVSDAGGHKWNEKKDTVITKAAAWFLAHYPLLGGLAASFRIIEDTDVCHRYEIHIAHEFLHAGLCHHQRCMGRDP